jgi:hypothetical protein
VALENVYPFCSKNARAVKPLFLNENRNLFFFCFVRRLSVWQQSILPISCRGSVIDKTIRPHRVAAWRSPAYRHAVTTLPPGE